MYKYLTLFLLLIATPSLFAQGKTDKLLLKILKKNKAHFWHILKYPEDYRVQILYTRIDRDAANFPIFKSYHYRVDKNEYFYPASTVKFPACLLALEKLNTLNKPELNRKSSMLIDSAYAGQTKQYLDKTNTLNSGLPTIEHYIKKILLVSDNDAYNRLYEFIGQEAFNEGLYKKGYDSLRIVHRLSVPLSREQNRATNPIEFTKPNSTLYPIYRQPLVVTDKVYEPEKPIVLGKGYMKGGQLVQEPFDFTYKNHFPIENQQAILKATLFPESVPATQRFNLTDDDYKFMWQFMSQLPTETLTPQYPDADSTGAWDSYCKFFMFGDKKTPMPKNVRIFNKVGDAYGFLIDNAYVVDFDKKVEFMLTAVIYCNADGVFNDDKYEYDSVGFPFMANLGNAIYNYEVKRKRKIKPNLSKFVFKYEK